MNLKTGKNKEKQKKQKCWKSLNSIRNTRYAIRSPSHGEFLKKYQTIRMPVRIILNKMNAEDRIKGVERLRVFKSPCYQEEGSLIIARAIR